MYNTYLRKIYLYMIFGFWFTAFFKKWIQSEHGKFFSHMSDVEMCVCPLTHFPCSNDLTNQMIHHLQVYQRFQPHDMSHQSQRSILCVAHESTYFHHYKRQDSTWDEHNIGLSWTFHIYLDIATAEDTRNLKTTHSGRNSWMVLPSCVSQTNYIDHPSAELTQLALINH